MFAGIDLDVLSLALVFTALGVAYVGWSFANKQLGNEGMVFGLRLGAIVWFIAAAYQVVRMIWGVE